MSKPSVRESVKWVGNFHIDGVEGDPDALHDSLYRMERLIIEQLPFTDAKVSAEYGCKLNDLKKARIDLYDAEVEMNKGVNQEEIKNVRSKLELAEEVKKLMNKISGEKESEEDSDASEDEEEVDHEELHDEVLSLYENAIMLYEGIELEENEDYDKAFDYLLNSTGEVEDLRKYLTKITKNFNESLYRRAELEKEVVDLSNDVRVLQENAFKGMAEDRSPQYKSTFRMEGKEDIKVDTKLSSVAKKEEKKKQFAENLVFANVSFIVEKGGKKFEVSVPVSIPNESVANLSRFKPAEYMSLELGSTYDSKNKFLSKQIEKRFLKGAEILGIDASTREAFDSSMLFSHSEQTLFSALLDRPDVRKNIAKNLKKELESNGGEVSEYKINGAALDIHTSRYMCDNCATCAIGMQDNNGDKTSFKNLLVGSIKKEINNLQIDESFAIHTRASASKDFQIPRKEDRDHSESVEIRSNIVSEKDIRIDRIYREHVKPYRSQDVQLLKELMNHTLFTSGDKEGQRFKTAYARAVSPLLEEAASTIQRGLKVTKCEKLSGKVSGISISDI